MIPVDVRVIAATNKNLRVEVERGTFRQDLFYRLNVLHIHVPPLRERPEDLWPLFLHLLRQVAPRLVRAAHAARAFLEPRLHLYPWPGNVRELENFVHRLTSLAPTGETMACVAQGLLDDLHQSTRGRPQPRTLRSIARQSEMEAIKAVLAETGGNVSEAARRLGISRTTLWRRIGSGVHN